MNSKPRRAQGGKGLLSRSISVQNPHESIPLILREERDREEERRAPGRGQSSGCTGKRERERERGVRGYLTPTTLNPKD